MRILIEGVDLSGKSTLARGLVERLRGGHIAARRGAGLLGRGLLARAAWWRYRSGADPTAHLQSWLFVAATVAEAMLRPPPEEDGEVLVQEGYVDHTIALCQALGRPVSAALARAVAPRLPGFDATILLVAFPQVRRLRLARRPHPDALDRLLVEHPDRAALLERRLAERVAARPNLLVLDSSLATPEALVERAIGHIFTSSRPQVECATRAHGILRARPGHDAARAGAGRAWTG